MGLTIDLHRVHADFVFVQLCATAFTRPQILFAFVHTPSICFIGFMAFDKMIPRAFCSFSSLAVCKVGFRFYSQHCAFACIEIHVTCFRPCVKCIWVITII